MIRVENVVKVHYRGSSEICALRGVCCAIPPDSMTFIVGPSGSGKSTLLYLLGALDEPTSGTISVEGRCLSDLSSSERDHYRRERVGFVFQSFNLLSHLTAIENVLVPFLPGGISHTLRRQAAELLTQVGLGDRIDHRPSQLSGGEQQRVAIARALLKRPTVVLADEPTGEVDTATGAEIFRHLRRLQQEQQTTVIVVTHDRRYIGPGDRVLEMRDGHLVT